MTKKLFDERFYEEGVVRGERDYSREGREGRTDGRTDGA